MIETRRPRYLWAYSAADDRTLRWHRMLLERRRARGYLIDAVCVTPASLQRRWLPFEELDRRWRRGDPALMKLYEEVHRALDGVDILILYNGANLHPEFVRTVSALKVYTAGDDPESTEVLTRPLAPEFDVHLVNNVACVNMYRDWGLPKVHFWPLGSLVTLDEVADFDEETILNPALRPLPIVFIGGLQAYRGDRLQRTAASFPAAMLAGHGWPRGFISDKELDHAYRHAQVGWNFHNSLGPVNFRTYELPAYGVMQICDNKAHLGQLFELGHEVVGFDEVDDCIELTRYYLAHPEEQRRIAVAGWRRWRADYHPDRIWERLTEIVEAEWRSGYHAQRTFDRAVALRNVRRRRLLRAPLWGFFQVGARIKAAFRTALARMSKVIAGR